MNHKNFTLSFSRFCGTWRLKFLATLFLGLTIVIHSNAQINGYSFNQSVQPYNPVTGGTVLGVATAASGTVTSLDDIIYFLPPGTIPFPFNFNGAPYTGLYVSTNGFITFGPTAPTQTLYNPISNATLYDGAISAVGRDLNGLFNINGNTGEIRYQTIYLPPPDESTPIEFVIQWSNVRPFNTSTSTTVYFRWNFQIRLQTNGSILFAYDFSATGVPNPVTNIQVGLRGATNSFVPNVNNRSIVNGVQTWITSVPGTLSNSDCDANASLLPVPGQTYTWTPPPPPPCPAPAGLAATNITSSDAFLNWSCAGCTGIFRLEYNITPATFEGIGNTVFESAISPMPALGLLPGTSYTFFVRQDCGINGFSTISSSTFTSALPGESCTDNPQAIPVYPNLGSSFNTLLTIGLTQDGPDGDCSNSIGNPAKKDRWVQFVAPANGNKLVVSTSSGTITDAVMQVWTDCPGAGGIPIACKNDAAPGNLMPEISLCQSQYIAGQFYYVRIWPYSATATGNYNLKIYETTSCPPPPVNDDCVNATFLAVNIYPACPAAEISGTTENATTSIGLANTTCDQFGTYNDVFYSFNSGSHTSLILNFTALTGASKAAVYNSCNGSMIECFDPGSDPFDGIVFNTNYIVRVWSNPGSEGTFTICLSEPSVPGCVSSPISPTNGAILVEPCQALLSWPAVPGATSFDVFLDPGLDPAVTLVSSNQTGTTYLIRADDYDMSQNLTFSWRVEPKNESGTALGCSDFTFTTAANLSSLPCYCPSFHSSGCSSGDEMTNVTLHTLNSPSGCEPGAYHFFPGITTSLYRDSTYTLTVSFGSDANQYFGAWIDYDEDGIFASSEFLGASGNAGTGGTASITFTVPDGASPGLRPGDETRFRIVGGNDNPVSSSDMCNSSSSNFGETEDYDISIVTPPPPVVTLFSIERINFHNPMEIINSAQLAIHYNYLNTGSAIWHLNIVAYDYRNGNQFWIADNLSIHPFPGTRDLVYEPNLTNLINLQIGDLTLTQLGIKIFVTDTVWFQPVFSSPSAYQPFPLIPVNYFLSVNQVLIDDTADYRELFPIPPNTFERTDTSRSVMRGCEMTNVPLDSTQNNGTTIPGYAGDWNACGPASAANSMQWLEERHPAEINTGLSVREKLKELSALMNRMVNEGVSMENFIKGKLAFIDKYKLPIHVKFQADKSLTSAATIPSPSVPASGHSGENKGAHIGMDQNNVDFDWFFSEMKSGEDVEAWIKTTDYYPRPGKPDSVVSSSHLAVVSGVDEVKGVKRIYYKDDANQKGNTGTDERTGTIATSPDGYPYISEQSGPYYRINAAGDTIRFTRRAWVEGLVSESYDPTITFPPVVDAGPDKTIHAGGNAKMSGSFGGNATAYSWSTSGSGVFITEIGAFFDVFYTYIPSAADIINGSVILTITTDALPGFTPASDQMTLTILPPPANTVINSIQRINYLYPEIIPLSTQFALHYNYLSIDTFIWHMNIMGYDYRTNTEFWLARNLSLHPFEGTRDLVFEPDMSRLINLQQGDTMSSIGIKLFVTDTIWYDPVTAPSIAYQAFSIQPINQLISNGAEIANVASLPVPHIYIPPNTFVKTDTARSVIRGCTMPNIDLDSSQFNGNTTPGYAGDWNACAPASTANSMGWLEARHPGKINSGLSLRDKLKEFSKLMQRQPNGPVSLEDLIKGKLAFIDKHKLPIHVKFQTQNNTISAATVASPHDPTYDHKAENKGANVGANTKNNIDFNWIFDEMKKGEDVEIYTCSYKFLPSKPDSAIPVNGHYLLLSGIEDKKGVRTIEMKDDENQENNTGVREQTGIKVDTVPGGYPFIKDKTEKDGIRYITYICGAISESYDSTITFAPKVAAGPDKTIPAGGKAKMAGVAGGSTTSIVWSSSGTGIFFPSNTDTIAEYIPSAADIISGSVILTIRSDSVPGYAVAEDQMTLTILPYPLNTTVNSIHRINYHYPFELELSPHIAISYSYTNLVNPARYMNLMGYDYSSNTQFWLAQNISLDSFPGNRDLIYEANLANLIGILDGNTFSQIGIALFVTDSVWYHPLSLPLPVYRTYPVLPIDYQFGKEILSAVPGDTSERTLPVVPVPPNTYTETDTTRSVVRGCTVPPLDLDSLTNNHGTDSTYASDWNSCGPASAASSMQWLEARHPAEINSGLSIREKLKGLSKLMKRLVNEGVTTENFIKGKLAYIDEHKLPIHVKYQSNKNSDANVSSPHSPSYGHKAENKGKNLGTNTNHVDFDWAFAEMKNGEDVEMWLTYQKFVPRTGKPDSVVNLGAHLVVLTGVGEVKGVKSLDYKDDTTQQKAGGTRERTGVKVGTTTTGAYPYIDAWVGVSGATYVTWVDGFFSESYDSTITFPPVVDAGPDKTIHAGAFASLSGSFDGSCIGITWSSSGSGTFAPSFFDVFATYIPSAQDIIDGSVVLTITTDALPGFTPAQDQMTLTILQPDVVTLNLKLFIEGLYMGGNLMQPMLYDVGLSLDPTAADSIRVDLWSPFNLSMPAYSTFGIVHNNGNASMTFPIGVLGQPFYIVVRHRNSLETWSKNTVLFNSTTVTFDFTSP